MTPGKHKGQIVNCVRVGKDVQLTVGLIGHLVHCHRCFTFRITLVGPPDLLNLYPVKM